jgi:hypothetical protein
VALALAIAAAGFAGCGDDSGGDDEAQKTGKTESPSDAYATAGPTKEGFCSAMALVDAPFVEAGQYASREQKIEAAQKVVDLLDDTAKAAPPDIADAAKVKLDAIRTAADGNPSTLIDSATLEATEKIKAYCPA